MLEITTYDTTIALAFSGPTIAEQDGLEDMSNYDHPEADKFGQDHDTHKANYGMGSYWVITWKVCTQSFSRPPKSPRCLRLRPLRDTRRAHSSAPSPTRISTPPYNKLRAPAIHYPTLFAQVVCPVSFQEGDQRRLEKDCISE